MAMFVRRTFRLAGLALATVLAGLCLCGQSPVAALTQRPTDRGPHTGTAPTTISVTPIADLGFSRAVMVNHDTTATNQTWPALVIDTAGTLHGLWADDNASASTIYYSRSTDHGGTWSAAVSLLDAGLSSSLQAYNPGLALDRQGNLHAVWCDTRNGNPDLFYSHLISGTLTWSPNVRVDDDTSGAIQARPAIAVDQTGLLHVTWADERAGNANIFYSRSNDGGAHWSSKVRVNDDTGTANQRDARIAVDAAGNVDAIWTDERNGNPDIYAARRVAATGLWSANVRVNDDTGTQAQSMPDIAIDTSGIAHAVWYDYRENNANNSSIYYASAPAGTLNWSANTRASDVLRTSRQTARLAVDSAGNVHVIWMDARHGSYDLYYARLLVGTAPWSRALKVNNDLQGASHLNPAVAVDAAGRVYALWSDNRHANSDIYSAAQIDLPAHFHIPLLGGGSTGDTTPPVVVGTSPANGAVGVSRDLLTVSITFSEPMAINWSLSSQNGYPLSSQTLVAYDPETHTYAFTRPNSAPLPAATVITMIANDPGHAAGSRTWRAIRRRRPRSASPQGSEPRYLVFWAGNSIRKVS